MKMDHFQCFNSYPWSEIHAHIAHAWSLREFPTTGILFFTPCNANRLDRSAAGAFALLLYLKQSFCNHMSLHILQLDASPRLNADSRRLSSQVVDHLLAQHPGAKVTYRDISAGLPLPDMDFANLVVPAAIDPLADAHPSLSRSNELVAELHQADIIVLGMPIYNWTIPGSFKTYVDLISRPGKTFGYVDGKRVGMLKATDAYVCFTTGGTALGGEADFASPYITFLWKTLGVNQVHWVHATGMLFGEQASLEAAEALIPSLPLPQNPLRA